MRILFLTFLCALAFAALPERDAHAAVPVPGDSCTEMGRTIIDRHEKDIIACVCDASSCGSGNLKWKSMSNNYLIYDTICPSGQVMKSVVNGQPICEGIDSKNVSCPYGIVSIIDGVPQCATL